MALMTLIYSRQGWYAKIPNELICSQLDWYLLTTFQVWECQNTCFSQDPRGGAGKDFAASVTHVSRSFYANLASYLERFKLILQYTHPNPLRHWYVGFTSHRIRIFRAWTSWSSQRTGYVWSCSKVCAVADIFQAIMPRMPLRPTLSSLGNWA
jgi:hypothetical protein